MDKRSVIRTCAEFYLESRDFNGIPLGELARRLNATCDEVSYLLRELVAEDIVTVLGKFNDNAHIIGTSIPENSRQLDALQSPNEHHTCVYVRPTVLSAFVPDDLYADEPYKRELALGEPQLSFRVFDMMVLEHYRNDPRYSYTNSDIGGEIVVNDQFYQSRAMAESDQVLLKTFGFAYDDEMNRAVAVFLRYLAALSPEHQQIWRTRQLQGKYRIHPDYYDMNILGSWGTNVSVCDALVAEIRVINEMCMAMEREPMFRKDFGQQGEDKPREFTLLIRPTHKEFHSFVSLLDRILSENLNHKFFDDEISFEHEIERKDGRIQIERKGTLRVLDEWLRKNYRTDDWTLWEQSLSVLREIRKIRQVPAHSLDDDKFDHKYFKEQRDLLIRAYSAVRTIRLMLQNHPKVRAAAVSIPDFLHKGKIVAW